MVLFRSVTIFPFRCFRLLAALGWIGLLSTVSPVTSDAETTSLTTPHSPLPASIEEEDFSQIKAHSPFLRTVGLSDDLVLTGMAKIEDSLFATLVDTETRVAHLVSERANALGWQLVGVRGDESDLESMTARIQVEGGDIVSIRYAKLPPKRIQGGSGSARVSRGGSQLNERDLSEAKSAARDYKRGFSSDGYPREPPPEVVRKLSRMTPQQRETLNREMITLRKRGLGSQERIKIYNQKIDQSLRGR